jgi:hypothetical protein
MDLQPLWDFAQEVRRLVPAWVLPWVTQVVSAAVLLTSLIGGYIYLQDFLLSLRYKKKGYRVERTLYKNVIENARTHVLKLRTLRILGKLERLNLDVWPTIEDPPPSRPCKLGILYSVPGRAVRDLSKIIIGFEPEERPKSHRPHAVALAYTIDENLDTLYTPPGLIADDPVGRDLLVVEIHFPATHLLRRVGEAPKVTLSARKVGVTDWTPIPVPVRNWFRRPRRTFVEAYPAYDFLGTGVPTDWLRLSIVKPPKNSQVQVEWEWDLKGAVPAPVHAAP